MFRQIRYQTGELQEVVNEMENGNIPSMDVDDIDEFNWVIEQLSQRGVYKIDDIPYDKNARDRIKEPDFEFRVAFSMITSKSNEVGENGMMFIDFFFEPDIEETYDPVGEM